MAQNKEISEDTIVGLSLKTIGAIIAGVAIVTLGYDLKDELIRETIMNTQSDVGDIKKQLDKIEGRLFEMK